METNDVELLAVASVNAINDNYSTLRTSHTPSDTHDMKAGHSTTGVEPLHVSILRFSDSCYTISFASIDRNNELLFRNLKSDNQNRAIYIAIDDVTIVGNDIIIKSSMMKFCDSQSNQNRFSFLDATERNIFTSIFNDCLSVRDLTLTLASLVRDLYFSGVYSNIDILSCADLPDYSVFNNEKSLIFERSSAKATDSSSCSAKNASNKSFSKNGNTILQLLQRKVISCCNECLCFYSLSFTNRQYYKKEVYKKVYSYSCRR